MALGLPISTGGKDLEQLLMEAEDSMRRADQANAQKKSQQAGNCGGSDGCGNQQQQHGAQSPGQSPAPAQVPQRQAPDVAAQQAARRAVTAGEQDQKSRCGICPSPVPPETNKPTAPSELQKALEASTRKAVPASVNANAQAPAKTATPQAPAPPTPPQDPTSQARTPRPQALAQAQTANRPDRILRRGDSGEDVRDLQKQLNAQGAKLEEDGKFGPKTLAALSKFQRSQGMRADGSAGPRTREALKTAKPTPRPPTSGSDRTSGTDRTQEPQATSGNPPNKSARIDQVSHSGARNQMIAGKITVNGHTYSFKSGGHARGSLPKGDYTVSNLRSTSQAGMVKDGVGFKADLSNKYDARVHDTRSALRIHPDGGSAGTSGCLGIEGNAATLRQFRADLAAEIKRNGGSFTLHIG